MIQIPRGLRILVIGDVMLDEYLRGKARRISPEAPVPVVEIERRAYFPGGAANVAVNIASLGATALLAGVVGEDAAARTLVLELDNRGVDTIALISEAGRSTTLKARVLAGSHQIVRFDEETAAPISGATENALMEAIHAAPDIAGFVLSDYAKGVLTTQLCRRVIAIARERGVPVVVDPKGTDFSRYHGATVITPNAMEAVAAARHLTATALSEDLSDGQSEYVAELLSEATGAGLVVTRGAEGMTVAERSGHAVHIPARAQQVFDVTGAGDTVVAALTLALAAKHSLEDAARFGNAAAAIAVGKVGTSAVTLDEINAVR